MHRVHRAAGSACALLLAVWFASGAVMTFSDFPRFTEQERLAHAPALPRAAAVALPPRALAELASVLEGGGRLRLAMQEGLPVWLYTNPRGERVSIHSAPPWTVRPLDAARARREAERRMGMVAAQVELVADPDQWTVALDTAVFPLLRVRFADPQQTEVYFSARSGELLQASTRRERAMAWVGAIPHWVYPTLLRQERALWRYTVLALSTVGLLVTLSGMVVGVHVHRATRKRRAPRDPYLRWHQLLGICFGLLATTWLASGALSLSPFQWAGARAPSARERRALHGVLQRAEVSPAEALARCQEQLEVRELELVAFASKPFAICAGASGESQLVDLTRRGEPLRAHVSESLLASIAQRLSEQPGRFAVETARSYDDYHYPTHSSPDAALPYTRIAINDELATVYYVDPARLRLLRKHTRLTRLERWLYHGLHSLDFPSLYARRPLWRTLVIAAMCVGFTLSLLGGLMYLRRLLRRWRRLRGSAPKLGAEERENTHAAVAESSVR